MFQSKICSHFLKRVSHEDDIFYCEKCDRSYYAYQAKEFPQPQVIDQKYDYNWRPNES